MQHSQDRGLVLCVGVCAFDPSLGVGWQEILSWYPVGWARLMEMVVVWSEAQWELSDIEDVGGPGWHWDASRASYPISDMLNDYGIDEVVNPVPKHMYSLGEFQSTIVSRWFVSKLHGLFWHVDCAWGHRMISILW